LHTIPVRRRYAVDFLTARRTVTHWTRLAFFFVNSFVPTFLSVHRLRTMMQTVVFF